MFKPTHSRTALFAILLGALLLPTAALADNHEEAMSEGGGMEQDAMAGDAMGEGDAMAGDAMSSENDDAMMMEDEDSMMEGGDGMMEEEDSMMEDDDEM
ncbi:hypothetical protein BOX17_07220 [Halomonas aestuarii]|uniref:Pentapeptide MXKDX repeat protein n=1 Tax=Halomonas aestuarii TaxID=1897729 RepID=A0A1J0VFH4_9GAMM|nr:hypothetical protein [Halomonas aestuarii]APE30759.1 hypothetical protein BOX17_07220 [Halomonas aestuarii]